VLVGALILALESANAQSALEADKFQQLQRQMEQLERQVKALKAEVAQATTKTSKVEAAGHTTQPPGGDQTKSPLFKATSWADRVKFALGGYLAADSVFRARNETSDIGSNFNAIPYPTLPQYGEKEFRGSARDSRLPLLAEASIDPAQRLAGYFEFDFNYGCALSIGREGAI
jgi:multidrug resistance efflux pump